MPYRITQCNIQYTTSRESLQHVHHEHTNFLPLLAPGGCEGRVNGVIWHYTFTDKVDADPSRRDFVQLMLSRLQTRSGVTKTASETIFFAKRLEDKRYIVGQVFGQFVCVLVCKECVGSESSTSLLRTWFVSGFHSILAIDAIRHIRQRLTCVADLSFVTFPIAAFCTIIFGAICYC